eukprot:jgi/Bigna1/127442/aug1.4_g2150
MSTIKVFGRVRPPRKKPRSKSATSTKGQHRYTFNGKVFNTKTTQEDIFEIIAEPVVESVLQGYNGTIFAYGQSGSGKSLNQVFDHVESCKDTEFVIRISYMEIYKNNGYDLLDPNHEPQQVEDLPKIVLRDDGSGGIHITNLNSLAVATREQALNHLFSGDTNRMICETANNALSSRSHCIFTVYVQAQEVGSEKVRVSKLNLVDLAGSERAKTVNPGSGAQVDNAKINLSLHHLANVIVALHKKAKGQQEHVPYRNSLLTSILKDSLGGNCKTTMIATLSVEESQIPETISTCRFAQRVAAIPNKPVINEAVDPKAKISSLQQQIEAMRQREERRKTRKRKLLDPMTNEEREKVAQTVRGFMRPGLALHTITRQLLVNKDRRVSAYAFAILREMVMSAHMACGKCGADVNISDFISTSKVDFKADTQRSPKRGGGGGGEQQQQQQQEELVDSSDEEDKKSSKRSGEQKSAISSSSEKGGMDTKSQKKDESNGGGGGRGGEEIDIDSVDWKALKPQLDKFRKDSEVGRRISSNNEAMRECHATAKQQGVELELLRESVNTLKARLVDLGEKRKTGADDDDRKDLPPSEEENRLALELRRVKKKYKEAYQGLKQQKIQLQHHLHVRERLERQLKTAFLERKMSKNNERVGGGGGGVGDKNSNSKKMSNDKDDGPKVISNSSSSSSRSSSSANRANASSSSVKRGEDGAGAVSQTSTRTKKNIDKKVKKRGKVAVGGGGGGGERETYCISSVNWRIPA